MKLALLLTLAGLTVFAPAQSKARDFDRSITIDYDIALPRAAALSAFTGSGGIEIRE